MTDGATEAERILMERLTMCINRGTHKRVPVYSEPLGDWDIAPKRARVIDFDNCPRCGIGRGFTYSTATKRVIRLL